MSGQYLRNLKGFTIIELLIVLIIVSLLISAASIYFESSRISSINGKRLGDILQISQAIDNYAAANGGQYPDIQYGEGCADKIIGGLNTTNFPGHQIPIDPNPEATVTTGHSCSSYENGYLYEVNKQPIYAPNDATSSKLNYLLQVGLQGNIDPAQGASFNSCVSAPDSTRVCYQLNGPYCGANCPNN
jgi:prepilin-type N-terminal cleavage/methylation domain-containing protein